MNDLGCPSSYKVPLKHFKKYVRLRSAKELKTNSLILLSDLKDAGLFLSITQHL